MAFRLPAPDEFLTEEETATMLSFSVAKLRGYRRRREIGCTVMGRHVLHSGKHIHDFIESCSQNVPDSPQIDSTGSANDRDQICGSGPGSITEAARRGAQALAAQTFSAPTKRLSSGGRKIAA